MPIANGARFTSGFGKRDIDNGPRDHWGLDFGGTTPGESLPVYAAAAGVVVWTHGYVTYRSGPTIKIQHPDGTATLYVHTRNVRVKAGQRVERGERLADSWHTGIPITNGIHLHFEWWRDSTDHTSVFDPRERLADYGWELRYDSTHKVYRMYDAWEGRSHKTVMKKTTNKTAIAVKAPEEKETDVSQPILANQITVWTDKPGGGLETETLSRWLLEQERLTEAIAEKVGLTYDDIQELKDNVKATLEDGANG